MHPLYVPTRPRRIDHLLCVPLTPLLSHQMTTSLPSHTHPPPPPPLIAPPPPPLPPLPTHTNPFPSSHWWMWISLSWLLQIISSVSAKTPVVVVLLNGRPLSINLVQDKVPAILEAWHLSISKLLVLSYPTLSYPIPSDTCYLGSVVPGGIWGYRSSRSSLR